MSLQEKIKGAKSNDWVTRDMPDWKIRLIIEWTQFKVRMFKGKIKLKYRLFQSRFGRHGLDPNR